jgi:ATP-binding cassette subfamily B (MDR/TAP) protein 1
LDFQSERVVQDALDKIREQRKLTTVTVAHRLTTIVNSDKIVVIADGTIQESGTHSELHRLGGIYTSLCEGQGLTADATNKAEVLGAIEEGTEMVGIKEEVAKIEVPEHESERELDLEKAEAKEVDGKLGQAEDIDDGVPDITGVASRLQKYNRPEITYIIAGYAGGIIVGALPAAEAILFGFITGNFYKFDTGQELRDVNLTICLWFILLAACSFIGNICMGIGKSFFTH